MSKNKMKQLLAYMQKLALLIKDILMRNARICVMINIASASPEILEIDSE